jgi:hypothetical protein
MKVIYRISDGGHNKEKPYYVNKRDTFLHFIKIFEGYDIYVVADNISDDTYKFLLNYININRIARTNLGNTGSFLASIQIAMDLFSDDDRVYLAEDDFEGLKFDSQGRLILPFSAGIGANPVSTTALD